MKGWEAWGQRARWVEGAGVIIRQRSAGPALACAGADGMCAWGSNRRARRGRRRFGCTPARETVRPRHRTRCRPSPCNAGRLPDRAGAAAGAGRVCTSALPRAPPPSHSRRQERAQQHDAFFYNTGPARDLRARRTHQQRPSEHNDPRRRRARRAALQRGRAGAQCPQQAPLVRCSGGGGAARGQALEPRVRVLAPARRAPARGQGRVQDAARDRARGALSRRPQSAPERRARPHDHGAARGAGRQGGALGMRACPAPQPRAARAGAHPPHRNPTRAAGAVADALGQGLGARRGVAAVAAQRGGCQARVARAGAPRHRVGAAAHAARLRRRRGGGAALCGRAAARGGAAQGARAGAPSTHLAPDSSAPAPPLQLGARPCLRRWSATPTAPRRPRPGSTASFQRPVPRTCCKLWSARWRRCSTAASPARWAAGLLGWRG
jgi:hypothetical protein